MYERKKRGFRTNIGIGSEIEEEPAKKIEKLKWKENKEEVVLSKQEKREFCEGENGHVYAAA